jgi:hypothetical protein
MLDMEEAVCQLSAAGCLNELSRLTRNKEKIRHTGGVEAIITLLRKEGDFLVQMVQEKAVSILLNIVEEKHLQNHCVKCGAVEVALKEAAVGTPNGKQSAAWILVSLSKYLSPEERIASCAAIGEMLDETTWSVRSAAARASMQLYRNDEEKMAFVMEGKGLERL